MLYLKPHLRTPPANRCPGGPAPWGRSGRRMRFWWSEDDPYCLLRFEGIHGADAARSGRRRQRPSLLLVHKTGGARIRTGYLLLPRAYSEAMARCRRNLIAPNVLRAALCGPTARAGPKFEPTSNGPCHPQNGVGTRWRLRCGNTSPRAPRWTSRGGYFYWVTPEQIEQRRPSAQGSSGACPHQAARIQPPRHAPRYAWPSARRA